jgi:hypothetical protein
MTTEKLSDKDDPHGTIRGHKGDPWDTFRAVHCPRPGVLDVSVEAMAEFVRRVEPDRICPHCGERERMDARRFCAVCEERIRAVVAKP